MKDLDFDELDRAVNSLMTNVPKTPEPKKDEDHEQTLTITPTINQDAVPSFNTLETTLSQLNKSSSPISPPSTTPRAPKPQITTPAEPVIKSTPATTPTQPPLAARRGRFMDVVRPASSIGKNNTTTPRPTSRLGATLKPVGPSLKDIIPSATSIPSTPAPISTPVLAPQTPTPPADKTDWPDPLDVAVDKHVPVLLEEPDTIKNEGLLESGAVTEKDNADEESRTPLSSPFLADAKVEKRPLGTAATPDAIVPEDTVSSEETLLDESSTDTQIESVPAAHPALPEELSSDITALEAGANTTALPVEAPTPTALTPEALAESHIETSVSKPSPAPLSNIEMPVTIEEKPVSTGPASIPQQYREEPSTGDKGNGSIYDTDTYHKPLAHPGKKKSGWMWVIWIIVILLLGAGGGAALYFMHIF
jgi:hypothetical protein